MYHCLLGPWVTSEYIYAGFVMFLSKIGTSISFLKKFLEIHAHTHPSSKISELVLLGKNGTHLPKNGWDCTNHSGQICNLIRSFSSILESYFALSQYGSKYFLIISSSMKSDLLSKKGLWFVSGHFSTQTCLVGHPKAENW